jgi:hypothetical protein
MTEPHNTGEKLRGRPFANGHDPRRNAGGRPKGLARLAREAVGGDGRDLVQFMAAVLRGDRKALRVHQITLRERMQAAEWLAERGFGKPPLVVDADLPEEPQVDFYDALGAWARSLPPELRKVVGEVMDRQFIEGIEADISVVDEQIKATMPDGWSSRPVQPSGGATKVPE